MITRGTESYKKAQELASRIQEKANTTKNCHSAYEMNFNILDKFLTDIKKLDIFASKIAETIDKGMNPHSYQVAKISDKQSWILACAAVENNINL